MAANFEGNEGQNFWKFTVLGYLLSKHCDLFFFSVFAETELGRKYSGKLSKTLFGNFYFWKITLNLNNESFAWKTRGTNPNLCPTPTRQVNLPNTSNVRQISNYSLAFLGISVDLCITNLSSSNKQALLNFESNYQ